jgi:hypothetical protein
MRTLSFVALSLFACGAAIGATSRSETTTYVDGNLAGISPNSGGTLTFSDDTAMYFKSGLETVAVPYAGIVKTELGATRVHSHDVPLYKVWSLEKRFSGRTQTQLLTVGFRNTEGEDKTMTLELAKPAAKSVLSLIQTHTAKNATPVEHTVVASAEPAKSQAKAKPVKSAAAKPETPAKAASDEWWGDQYWKTTRNAGTWTKPAGTSGSEQQ